MIIAILIIYSSRVVSTVMIGGVASSCNSGIKESFSVEMVAFGFGHRGSSIFEIEEMPASFGVPQVFGSILPAWGIVPGFHVW